MKLRLIIALASILMLFSGAVVSAQDDVVLNVLAMDQAGMTPRRFG